MFAFPRLYWTMLNLFTQPRLYWTCPVYGLWDNKTNFSEVYALPSGNTIWCPNSTDSLRSRLVTPGLTGTLAGRKMLPESDSGPTWWFMHTQTHHNNKLVVAVEFTCVTGKSSTRSTHYRTQGCEVSPYEDAINGPSSPTFLCTSCLPSLFHPFQRAGPVTQEAYKTVNLTNGNRIPVPMPQGRISSTHATVRSWPLGAH